VVSPLDLPERRDRRTELLEDFFELARRELTGERGQRAREYLESRGLPREALEACGLGVVPPAAALGRALVGKGYSAQEVDESGLLADRRSAGRICGAWCDERGRIRTLWARTLDSGGDPGAKYLYLRGASRTGLPPYGLSEVLARQPAERRELVLVEGLLDPHHFRARGIPNIAALGGTSTPPETFERLAHLGFQSVTICLDRDAPGRSATARAIDRAVRAKRSPAISCSNRSTSLPRRIRTSSSARTALACGSSCSTSASAESRGAHAIYWAASSPTPRSSCGEMRCGGQARGSARCRRPLRSSRTTPSARSPRAAGTTSRQSHVRSARDSGRRMREESQPSGPRCSKLAGACDVKREVEEE
jgi:hypothetical protein